MSRRNYHTPPPTTVPPSPAEIVDAPRVPRKQLVVTLRVTGPDPAVVALASARFIATVQAADRKLRLLVDPTPTRAVGGDVTLTFTPARQGIEANERLEKIVAVAREAATAFDGATLSRVEVVTRG